MSQQILFSRLERSADIRIAGRNHSPFAMHKIYMTDLTIERKKLFKIHAQKAWISFSPFETLLGQIPLAIDAQNLTGGSGFGTLGGVLKDATFEKLNAKMTVFVGKGVNLEKFHLVGAQAELNVEGKILRKKKGDSDLKVRLFVAPDFLEKNAGFLVKNIFSHENDGVKRTAPYDFRFHLTGNIERPLISLESDLIEVNVKLKERA